MQSIDKAISALSRQVSLWTELLRPALPRLRQLDRDSILSYPVIEDEGGEDNDTETDSVSAGFALESLVVTLGRLEDVVTAGKACWPGRAEEFQRQLASLLDSSVLQEISEFLRSSEELASRIGFQESDFSSLYLDTESGTADLVSMFDVICDRRRYIAKTRILGGGVRTLRDNLFAQRNEDLIQHLLRFEEKDKRRLVSAVRRYLAAEYLFPWIRYEPEAAESSPEPYRYIFQIAGLDTDKMIENRMTVLDEILSQQDANHEHRAVVSAMFQRLGTALEQLGSYEDLVSRITEGGGQWGGDSMLGVGGPVNIIPSGTDDQPCRKVLVAFAQGKRAPKGLKSIVRLVREHLIRCGDSGCQWDEATQIVMIFTDVWDPEILAESLGDFREYSSARVARKTIIGALVNGSRITPQALF